MVLDQTPVVNPGPGVYTESVQISIDVPVGCKAYYTWDGTNPKEFHNRRFYNRDGEGAFKRDSFFGLVVANHRRM